MSRTDKDRPYWVQLRDPRADTVEYHQHYPGWWSRRRAGTGGTGVCDLADWDAATDVNDRTNYHFNCGRELRARYWRYRFANTPGWFTHHVWWEPERGRERDQLRAAARAYNAGVDRAGWAADFDFPHHQHRHCGRWLWD